MEASNKNRIIVLIVVVMMINMVESGRGELYKVGERGWIPDYNYTHWLIQHHPHFYVGDWLYFIFDKHYCNVLEVNKTSYENCNDKGFIKNITRGGRDVYELKEARPYYFLSSGGYCWNGMKLAISVQSLPPTPAPAPPKISSSSSFTAFATPIIALFVAFVCTIFLYKP